MIDSLIPRGYVECRQVLTRRLAEPPPTRLQILAGPRQVGKTTLLLDLARTWESAAIYAAADGPEAALPGFWDRVWDRAEAVARQAGRAVVLIDEIHAIERWAARLKGEWDRIRRRRLPIHVLVTGSAALRLGSGSRESLAGRFERLVLSHWPAASLATVFGIGPAEAADLAVRLGTYPGAFDLRGDRARWLAYVRDAIVEPAIGRDVLALAAVRKPALLRQVFGAAISAPAQIVSLQKIQGQLLDAGALETVAHYLSLLEEAYLVAALPKHSATLARRRAAPPKLVTLNNALLAALDPQGTPDPAGDPSRFGRWLENACLAFAWNGGQRVTYWREEPLEVDGVLEGSWGSWAVEVKMGHVQPADLRGLLEFTRRFPTYRPLVVGDRTAQTTVARLGIATRDWHDFLLAGPAD
jgi:hypothetical protein